MPNKNLYVWMDGKMIDSADAKVHVLTHSLQYGSGIFEGIRAYKTEKGHAIFRLREHARRFINSSKIINMPLGLTQEQIEEAIVATVKKNDPEGDCYIRPFAFYNDSQIGLGVLGKKVSTVVAALPFGNYFKNKDAGVNCKVSTWERMSSSVLPPQAKASGNYANSILASQEAKLAGFDEAILLSLSGHVAEGPGENIFIVRDNKLITPSVEADILTGITRDSLIKVAEAEGITVEERLVHKEELYVCDEAFFSGTAAELTPIVSIDSRKIGDGKPGPITRMLSDKFSRIVHGKEREYLQWLTFVK